MFFFSSLLEAREETERRESIEPRTSLLAGWNATEEADSRERRRKGETGALAAWEET